MIIAIQVLFFLAWSMNSSMYLNQRQVIMILIQVYLIIYTIKSCFYASCGMLINVAYSEENHKCVQTVFHTLDTLAFWFSSVGKSRSKTTFLMINKRPFPAYLRDHDRLNDMQYSFQGNFSVLQ